jgi:hypothetical protein
MKTDVSGATTSRSRGRRCQPDLEEGDIVAGQIWRREMASATSRWRDGGGLEEGREMREMVPATSR